MRGRRMGKRVTAATAALLLSGALLPSLASCNGQAASPQPSEPAAQASDTSAADEARAVEALRTWLGEPQPGTLTISSVDDSSSKNTEISKQLSGTLDPAVGTASLVGTKTVLTGSSTNQTPLRALMADDKLYTTSTVGHTPPSPSPKWTQQDLAVDKPATSPHSVWWTVLENLEKVRLDGASEVDGKSATEFTGTVDAGQIPSLAKLVSASMVFKKAGTTKVSIDLYTDLGTGALVRLTYRLGLQLSVDATPTATSTAGYEVDLTGLGSPTMSASPSASTPAALDVTRDGSSGDICQLILF
jgi:hypothetical protein